MAMPKPVEVSLRADQVASSAASAGGRVYTPAVAVGAGRLARVNTFARGTPAAAVSISSRLASVPPQPRVRYTVPWLVPKVPLSVVATGYGRRVSAVSAPRQGKVRS